MTHAATHPREPRQPLQDPAAVNPPGNRDLSPQQPEKRRCPLDYQLATCGSVVLDGGVERRSGGAGRCGEPHPGSVLPSTSCRSSDPATGATRHALAGHTREVRALAVAPDGSWLASANVGGQVQIWDVVTGTVRHTLSGHAHEVRALLVAPDGA